MLRTNLSTRPFYNERAVHTVLTIAAIVVVALAAFNVTQIVVLGRRQSELSAQAAATEQQAESLRANAQRMRRTIDPKQLQVVAGAAQEANAIIDRRLFSWTDLLNQLETTLPEDVRITSIRPKVEQDGTITVSLTLIGRRVDDIDRFIERLEATGAFADVLSREENTTEDGMLLAVLDGRYVTKSASAGGR